MGSGERTKAQDVQDGNLLRLERGHCSQSQVILEKSLEFANIEGRRGMWYN